MSISGIDGPLDTLSRHREEPLAPPFDAIFADRAQAEWAFDLFADVVKRLGSGPDDERFALTMPAGRDTLRLNMGNWSILSIALRGTELELTLLVEPMEKHFSFKRSDLFRDTEESYAIFSIPATLVSEWPDDLRAIYESSMSGIGEIFRDWSRSNHYKSHVDSVFQALFDEAKRERLLAEGLPIELLPNDGADDNDTLPSPDGTTIAREFHGFTMDAFDFLRELQANNNTTWMAANEERWIASVREPMRALFTDLGPHLKQRFDRFLAPDELEIAPKFGRTLATIKKRWPDDSGPYHTYYWGAFYRAQFSKQTDAQLFINILAHTLRFGFYVGERAKAARDRFQRRVQADPQRFLELVKTLQLTQDFDFVRTHEDDNRQIIPIRTADDLLQWIETGDYDLLQNLDPGTVVELGPRLADCILEALRRVFPVYLWAVLDDPDPVVERYLAAEFPPDDIDEGDEPPPPPYTRADFLRDTYLTEDAADELCEVLLDRRQVIFYGPPGTGKTWVARHLGRRLTGLAEPPPERLTVVQFHPAYGYEDFMEGIRPESRERDGSVVIDYPVRQGVFQRFCRDAAQLGEDKPCVLIIDEINRGNLPRIFGELMYLLEYRDQPVRLPYSNNNFRIPRNVYLIGTMNTADRSIALVDFALRRRFQFFHFEADPDLFDRWLRANPSTLPYLAALYRALAMEAIDDRDFRIGPSYFMRTGLDERALARIWRLNIEPALREYYIDQHDRVDAWRWDGERVRAIRERDGAG